MIIFINTTYSSFRYHEVGSKKLNACIRFFLCMVYFNLSTKQCYSQITRNSTQMHRYIAYNDSLANPPPCFPFCPNLPPFIWLIPSFYLENQLLLCVVQIPIHSCPWFAINCSPLAASLLHPLQGTPQIKLHIYIDDISNISRPVWHK